MKWYRVPPQFLAPSMACLLLACGGGGSSPVSDNTPSPSNTSAVAPSATISVVSPVNPVAGQMVSFTSTGSARDGLNYSWNYGDGSAVGAGVASSHNYASGGGYTVTLTVTNSLGQAAAAVATVNVTPLGLALLAGSPGGAGNADGTGAAAGFTFPSGTAVDSSGNVYVADTSNSTIRKITPTGVVTTLAGTATVSGSADGTGAAARFAFPTGVDVDGNGNVYVADQRNDTIRKITPAGIVTTLAGTATVAGSADGTGTAAKFSNPAGVAVDGGGNVYVADEGNNTIRKITPAGVVTTLAGTAAVTGSADGTGAAAQFYFPTSVAVDNNGTVYVADADNNTIRKVSPAGVVSTLAGTARAFGSDDGTGSAAQFSFPYGIAVGSGGTVYVADQGNNTIRKITPTGAVTTLAGTAGSIGSNDGTGAAARFHQPAGIAADGNGTVYVADANNDTIRKITAAAVVTTLAGAAKITGSANGTGIAAEFDDPYGVATDSSGNVYVADADNDMIRKVSPAGVVTTLAGMARVPGSADGTGTAAQFNAPTDVAVDAGGNVYVADSGNNTIRKITPAGVVTTLAGTAGVAGGADGMGTAAQFSLPYGVGLDANGNLYVADADNDAIRKITPSGMVTTFAGTAGQVGSVDGTGAAARFNNPWGVVIDSSGNVFVADTFNDIIRKITATSVVTTIAGTAGLAGSADGTGATARFIGPASLALDGSGNLYVADIFDSIVRKVTPAGMVSTIIGEPGQLGYRFGPLPGRIQVSCGIAMLSNGAIVFSSNNAILTAAGF